MKIAQVAPLIESVPPRLYGGTERIVSYLTEELVRLGHDVTLFASGDSISSAELAPCCTRALRLDPTMPDTLPHFMLCAYLAHNIPVARNRISTVRGAQLWRPANRPSPIDIV
jgi:glycosyltransferase involved in cell wall biosynthesis